MLQNQVLFAPAYLGGLAPLKLPSLSAAKQEQPHKQELRNHPPRPKVLSCNTAPARSWLQSHTSRTLQKQWHQAPAIGTQLNPSSTSGISLFSPAVLQPLPGDNIYSLGEIYYLPTSSQHALNYRLACESEWVPVLAGMSRTLLHLFWIKNLKQVFVDSTLVSHALIGQERARETPTEGCSSSPQLKAEVKTFSGFYSGATHISLSSLLPRWA